MLPSDQPHDCSSYQDVENIAYIPIHWLHTRTTSL